MYSTALPTDLAIFLAFSKARDLNPKDLTTSCSISHSFWGDLSKHIFGRN